MKSEVQKADHLTNKSHVYSALIFGREQIRQEGLLRRNYTFRKFRDIRQLLILNSAFSAI